MRNRSNAALTNKNNTRGVPNSDFCRIRIFCRIHFAESEYSAEHSALPNNEKICLIKRVFNADV